MFFSCLVRTFIVPVLLLVPVFACGETTPFHWTGRLAPDQKLVILGVTGSISIETVEGDTVEVMATAGSSNSNPAHVEVMESRERVAVCAIYANSLGASPSTCSSAQNQWCRSECDGLGPRVDCIVRLPRTVRSLDLFGVNAAVTGRFGPQGWPDQVNVCTVSGNVELELHASASIDMEILAPARHLRCVFPVTLQPARRAGSMKATIGQGDSKLRISTVSGYVRLKKSPQR